MQMLALLDGFNNTVKRNRIDERRQLWLGRISSDK
jgi:hypothetical protein